MNELIEEKMKKLLTSLLLLVALVAPQQATGRDFSNEVLNYEIVYHWGVIWKHAADAKLSIRKTTDGYYSQLSGKTRSWADKVYPVRDTLKCTLNAGLQPLKYEKLTHEKDYYARDVVNFTYNYSHTSAKCYRYRPGRETVSLELKAQCQAYDMLSVFYMLRGIDYDALNQNKAITTVIFSGKEKEYLTIRYVGKTRVKLRDGNRRDSYHIKFKFTQKNGKQSSDDLDAWLSTDAARIPLLLEGKLPVGKVKCYFAP